MSDDYQTRIQAATAYFDFRIERLQAGDNSIAPPEQAEMGRHLQALLEISQNATLALSQRQSGGQIYSVPAYQALLAIARASQQLAEISGLIRPVAPQRAVRA